MGKSQRVKGATFERLIASKMRDAFPGTSWRRSRQSDGAAYSDVHCYEGPKKLRRLWLEANHSNAPRPAVKMAQAMRDIGRLDDQDYHPVVVWRKTGCKAINCTPWLASIYPAAPSAIAWTLVTCEFDDFVNIIRSLRC